MNPVTGLRELPPLMRGLVGAYVVSGVTHLVRPQVFEPTIPPQLPKARELVYLSGVAELVCAAGLVNPATRRAAGYASAALLVAVLPANVEMARQAQASVRRRSTPGKQARLVGMLARVPAQWPLIKASLDIARR